MKFIYKNKNFLVRNKLRKIDTIMSSSKTFKKNAKNYILNTKTHSDFSKSIYRNENNSTNYRNENISTNYRNENVSTNYRSIFSEGEVLPTLMSNGTSEDFFIFKTSNFKNENDYKRHFQSKSKDKTINNLMTHIVIFFIIFFIIILG